MHSLIIISSFDGPVENLSDFLHQTVVWYPVAVNVGNIEKSIRASFYKCLVNEWTVSVLDMNCNVCAVDSCEHTHYKVLI